MHAYQSVAIDCLLRRGEISSKALARAQKKARAPVVASDPSVLEKESSSELIYAHFRQCFDFDTPANLTKVNLANVNKIWNAAMNIKELTKGTISFKPEMNDQALQVRSKAFSPHLISSQFTVTSITHQYIQVAQYHQKDAQ